MSGGILSGLLGGMIGGDQTQMGSGILGNMNNYMRDNAGTLLGFGSGMLAGDNSAAAAGALQGMQADQRTRLLKQKQAEEERQKVALQQAAQKLGIDPILAEANPDLVGTVAAQRYKPREQTEFERLTAGMSPEMVEQAKMARLGLTRDNELKPVSIDDPATGMKRTVFQRGGQFYTPEQLGLTDGSVARPANPYAPPGGGTVEQNNASMFANRAAQAHQILNEKEDVLTSKVQSAAGNIPLVGNSLVSEDKQLAEQAKVNFITAVLRKESGASISPGEFEQAEKVYFPQPGDTAETIKQKRDARITAVKGLIGSSGNRRPPQGWEDPTTAGAKQEKPKDPPAPSIPSGAVEYLRKNPSLRQQFDAKYGPGSADRVLGRPDA
jgi:hypothetical protein